MPVTDSYLFRAISTYNNNNSYKLDSIAKPWRLEESVFLALIFSCYYDHNICVCVFSMNSRCLTQSNVRAVLERFEKNWPVAFALTLYGKLFVQSPNAEQILLDMQVEGAHDERDANRIRVKTFF